MAYPCFHCDVELVPGAKYCHQCGAPVLLTGVRRPADASMAEEDRVRIKQEVQQAASVPVTTRSVQTVLGAGRERRGPPPPPLRKRIPGLRLLTRPVLWLGLVAVGAVLGSLQLVEYIRQQGREQGETYQIITRLAAACPQNSRAELGELIGRIHASPGGRDSPLEAARLFYYVARSARLPDGNCAALADALSQPHRFDALVR